MKFVRNGRTKRRELLVATQRGEELDRKRATWLAEASESLLLEFAYDGQRGGPSALLHYDVEGLWSLKTFLSKRALVSQELLGLLEALLAVVDLCAARKMPTELLCYDPEYVFVDAQCCPHFVLLPLEEVALQARNSPLALLRALGNPDRLRAKCAELGIGCDIIGKVEEDGITISSTYIRTLIAQGEMERARQFLGHPHILAGRVEHGKKIGRSLLGFPTVNLQIPPRVIVPAFGVYATRVWFDGQCHSAVTNVGVRPTVKDNDGHVTVEGFILDYDGDLYGREIRMEFHKYLRGEQTFPSMEALAKEIEHNARQTRNYFRTLA